MKKIDISYEFIKENYLNNGLNLREVAKLAGVSRDVVSARAKEYGIILRPSGRKNRSSEIINKTFNDLFVIKYIDSKDKKHRKYECKCKCGAIVKVDGVSLLNNGTKRCWECRSESISIKKRKGYREISGEFWNRTKRSASVRNYEFSITIEYIWELFEKQNRKCVLSGVDIRFNKRREDISFATASLDRIDSSIGYIEGNVQWVHKIVNNLKMDLNEQEFILWCEKIAEYKNAKKSISS